MNGGPCSAVGGTSDSRAKGPGLDTRSGHILSFLLLLIQERQLSVTGEVPVGLSLPRKRVFSLTDRPDMTLAVYPRLKKQQQQPGNNGLTK